MIARPTLPSSYFWKACGYCGVHFWALITAPPDHCTLLCAEIAQSSPDHVWMYGNEEATQG